ncbi:MAG: fructose-bisphosphatase class II, partial [Shimia sp.]
MSYGERVRRLARAKACSTDAITVCILDRPRHAEMIAEVRATGAAIRLITDGDVAGVMHCAEPDVTVIELYWGQGGAPEGVLAAAALKCMGGQIQGQLLFRDDAERGRAAKAGIEDFDRVYDRDEMVAGDVIFAATGVTDGSLLRGIKREVGHLTAETILMRSKTGSVRRMIYRNPIQ